MSSKEKKDLVHFIEEMLKERVNELKIELQGVIASRDAESKSSVGDKYETSRAMMHIAQEQTEKQISQQQNLLQQLRLIPSKKIAKTAQPGALIMTNHGQFFLAIGLGELTTPAGTYISISPASPIGKMFEGKVKGDIFSFMGRSFEILAIL